MAEEVFLNVREKMNDIYFDRMLFDENRYMVLYGGAGSGKSIFACQKVLHRILLEKDHKILILRKVARTIRNSVFALFKSMISDWGLSSIFEHNKTEMSFDCKALNSQIIMLGLDDVEKLKSISGITSIWIEEATELTEDDLKQVNLRLRGKTPHYKQIIMTFNPISSLHWLKRRFFDSAEPNTSILKTTYKDNAFIDDEYKAELEKLASIDKTFYNVYTLGEWGMLKNLVLSNWSVEDLAGKEFSTYYMGLDFGFTNDPTAFIKMAVKDGTIYILDEIYEKGLTNDKIAEAIKGLAGGNLVTCDSSEPKSIAELRNYGINATGAKKGKDSVIFGIQWLRQHRILVDRRCQNVINEMQTYRYREDKDGNILNEPLDMNNHTIDAIRYAGEHIMHRHIVSVPKISAGSLGL